MAAMRRYVRSYHDLRIFLRTGKARLELVEKVVGSLRIESDAIELNRKKGPSWLSGHWLDKGRFRY